MHGEALDLEALCYAGEEVLATVPVGGGGNRLVATTHRVLALTPEDDGADLVAVERPNVRAVTVETTGNAATVPYAVRALVVGVVLVLGGATVSLDGMLADVSIGDSGASAVGFGWLLELFDLLQFLFAVLDDAMLVLGAVLSLAGVGLMAAYWASRERAVVVSVAGGDDIVVPAAGATAGDLRPLRDALGLGSAASGGS